MRISSSLFFQTGLNSINAQQSDLMHLFQQIGSGQRMVTPADDPLAAAQAINISQAQTMNQRYADNREIARQNLGVEESTLNSVTLLMQDIKTRLVEAGNGTMSDADRMTLSKVLEHARTTLLGLANATDGSGQYLFSGSKGEVPPFDEAGDYAGDTSQRNIQVDQTRRMAGSDVGSDIFSRATPGITSYLTADAGTHINGTPLNAGTGVISTATVYDAAQVIPGHHFTLEFTATNAYVVTVFDDQGNDVGSENRPFTPGTDNLIKLPQGVQVRLSGEPIAGDTFNVSPAAGQDINVFKTLDAMIATLAQPFDASLTASAHFRNVLASGMQRLDANYDTILTIRASVGARFNELDALEANGGLRDLGYRNQLSRLEDLDYYTATTQLELRKSALEAASLAFRKIQGTSLFNMGQG